MNKKRVRWGLIGRVVDSAVMLAITARPTPLNPKTYL
jgi:hypothetical protein